MKSTKLSSNKHPLLIPYIINENHSFIYVIRL